MTPGQAALKAWDDRPAEEGGRNAKAWESVAKAAIDCYEAERSKKINATFGGCSEPIAMDVGSGWRAIKRPEVTTTWAVRFDRPNGNWVKIRPSGSYEFVSIEERTIFLDRDSAAAFTRTTPSLKLVRITRKVKR